MKTFLKSRGDLNPCWKACSRAETRPHSPQSNSVKLPRSFSGLWKCFTMPLTASPMDSWICPVFSLGLLLGEMVTSLRMTLGDCCRGGVRQGLSSTSGREVSSSPTSTRSRLPSSIPFPSHRPHGNLEVKQWSMRAAHFSSFLPCNVINKANP